MPNDGEVALPSGVINFPKTAARRRKFFHPGKSCQEIHQKAILGVSSQGRIDLCRCELFS
jgi:hypothetical protein